MAEIRIRTLAIAAAVIIVPLMVWLVLDLAIETEGEKIERVLDDMAAATEAKDPAGMVQYIAQDYEHQGLTRADLQALAKAYFEDFGDTSCRIASREINITGSLAIANVVVMVRSERGETAGTTIPTRWQFTFARQPARRLAGGLAGKRWQIVKVTPLAIGRMQLENWQPLCGRLRVRPSVQPPEM